MPSSIRWGLQVVILQMNFLLLLPIFACVTCCVLAAAIFGRGAPHRVGRLGAALAIAAAYWALCEILWTTSDDSATALWLIRAAAVGWISIGPITLHLFLELSGNPARERRAFIATVYGLNALLVALGLFTPWLDEEAIRTSWGWGYRVGPIFPFAYLFTGSTFFAGMIIGLRNFRAPLPAAERTQANVLIGGMMVAMAVASFTDGLLPALGHQVPRMGVVAITLFACTVGWSFQRYGYSLLAPGVFASEILATLPDGVALLHMDGRIRYANRCIESFAGVEPGRLEEILIETLVADFRCDPLEQISERECTIRSNSGIEVPVSISTSTLNDKQSNPIGLVLVARDLREVASLRSRLVISDRLAAVGQLAAGIAHEINNPVAFVRSNLGALYQLLNDVGSKMPAAVAAEVDESLSDGRELLEESLDGVDRVAAIVRDVKSFSHAGEARPERVDLNLLLDSVLRVSSPQIPAGCEIERRYTETPEVLGAPQELQQVFLNLVVNAAQAIESGDTIRVTTFREHDQVVTLIEDGGSGIAPEAIERIFDPFFTTKAVGEGTGLGLAISYQIILNHHGHLSVESELGRGTRFRVELPTLGDEDLEVAFG
jgi:signal transduction histidine kinase